MAAATRVSGDRTGRMLLVLAILVEIFAIWWVNHIQTYGYMDTQIYRFGAQAWLNGDSIYGPLPETTIGNRLPFIYPPFAAVLFAPLAWLPVHAAIIAFAIVSNIAVLVTAYALARSSPFIVPFGSRRIRIASHAGQLAVATAVIAAVITLVEPGRGTFAYGQINMVLMAMVAADCLLPKTTWPRGMLVGLAAAIKLTPLAFLAFFLLRKDFRALLTTGITFAVTVLIGWFAAPSDSVEWWFDRMLKTAENFNPSFAANQTVRSLLVKFGVSGTPLTVGWLLATVVLGLLMLAAMHHALRDGNAPLALMANAVWALLVSPISWSHHWVWAAPALVLLLCMAIRQRRHVLLPAVLGAAAVIVYAPHWPLWEENWDTMTWTVSETIVGNLYTLIGMAFLVAGGMIWLWDRRTVRAPATEGDLAGTGDPPPEGDRERCLD